METGNKLAEFWKAFNALDAGESCIEQAGEKCVDLAGTIIPELESQSNDAISYLRGLVITLGSENTQHSAPVDTALRAARQFLMAEAKANG